MLRRSWAERDSRSKPSWPAGARSCGGPAPGCGARVQPYAFNRARMRRMAAVPSARSAASVPPRSIRSPSVTGLSPGRRTRCPACAPRTSSGARPCRRRRVAIRSAWARLGHPRSSPLATSSTSLIFSTGPRADGGAADDDPVAVLSQRGHPCQEDLERDLPGTRVLARPAEPADRLRHAFGLGEQPRPLLVRRPLDPARTNTPVPEQLGRGERRCRRSP